MSGAISPGGNDARSPIGGSRPQELLGASFLTVLLIVSFFAVPLLGTVALPFAAVPTVRLTHRRGVSAGLGASALAAGLLGLVGAASGGLSAAFAGAFLACLVAAAPACFAGAVRRGLEPSRAYLALCAAGYAILTGGLILGSPEGRPAVREEIRRSFEGFRSAAIQSYGKAGMDDPETIARLKDTLQKAEGFATRFWAGLAGASWVLASAIGFYTGARLARPAASAEAVRFESLYNPPALAALFVVSGAGVVLGPPVAQEIAGDLLLPLCALYFLGGLSIMCHFARKRIRATLWRAGLYALVLYFPINAGVALVGLFDWYADFRKRNERTIQSS